MSNVFLENDIIYLRAPEPADLDTMYLWENDTTLWIYGQSTAPYSRQMLWLYIENYEADIYKSQQLRFVIVEKSSNTPVGLIDLFNFCPKNKRAEIGIMIDKHFQNQGYATAAIETIKQYCSQVLDMHQLSAITAKDNEISVSLFKRCGFTTSGYLRSWIRNGKSYLDAYIFQILFS